MTITAFNLDHFALALPTSKATGKALWLYKGLVEGEHTFSLPVKAGVAITIRSTVDESGWCRGTGKDSIRAWLTDDEGRPLGSKVQSYVTRINGWEGRMVKVLRELYKRGLNLNPCPVCGAMMGVYKVKKEGPNKGRLFVACKSKPCNQFHWVH